jgi:hypothetical protein
VRLFDQWVTPPRFSPSIARCVTFQRDRCRAVPAVALAATWSGKPAHTENPPFGEPKFGNNFKFDFVSKLAYGKQLILVWVRIGCSNTQTYGEGHAYLHPASACRDL